MSVFLILDLMARGGIITLIAMWSWLLLRYHARALSARLAIAMNIAISAHVIASMPVPTERMTVAIALLDTLSGAAIPLFWLFSKAWFNDERRISWISLVVAAIPALIIALLDFQLVGKSFGPSDIWFPLLRGAFFIFAIAGMWVAWRGRADDLVETRRRFRLKLVASAGIACVLVNGVEVAAFAYGAPAQWRSFMEILIFAIVAILCSSIFTLSQTDLFDHPEARTNDAKADLDEVQTLMAGRLATHLETNKSWRDEGLTITALANQLGEQEYKLRRLINGFLGYRNFPQFLNRYRLAEVRSALVDPSQKDVPILTIALDAGFGSLGPFNRAFREAEGMTPSEYRQAGKK